ncbi:MAG: carboxypeptidase regulatory-like domain-containing protein [Verrucomicrobiales bacterium]|jgi:beta-lactamase regulating signal transducer with metallopeptidase domain/5-hydroxyisourate hydrolase-like protein (transthyretin family)|nr:carboxypeptidase regulatory-like domain-containing protein [Verrucomicrobiales bacterium]
MTPLTVSLLHSLWQGAALWLALTVALRLLPARAATARYALATGALTLTVLAWLLTWAWLGQSPTVTVSAAPPVSMSVEVFSTTSPLSAPALRLNKLSNPINLKNFPLPLPWDKIFTVGWLLGVVGGFWRMASSLSAARRLVAGAAPVAAPAWVAEFGRLRATLTARTEILLRSSAQILSPCVAGLWRPVVLVPASMLTGTPPELLRAILAHELAHIRRRDWLVNLFQLGAEALLFFNPFVWLVSRVIRREREACCDAIASGVCADRAAYSDALVWCARRTPALTAGQSLTMTADKRWLRDRVTRVLFPAQIPKGRVNWPLAAGIALTVAAVFAALTVSVRATVKKFTDRERVDAIVEAAREQGNPMPFEVYDETQKIRVSGSFITPDGRDVGWYNLGVKSAANRSTHSIFRSDPGKEFSVAVARGRLTLVAWAEGYAPVNTDVIYPAPDQTELENLTLAPTEGFAGIVQLIDGQGRAVAGVQCKLRYSRRDDFSIAFPQELESDSDGRVIFHNVEDSANYELEFFKSGFQWMTVSGQRFVDGQSLTVRLSTARIISGTVSDAETGRPIVGASVAVSRVNDRWQRQSLAVSDSDGRLAINTLGDEAAYRLEFSAEGYRSVELPLERGQTSVSVALSKGFTVSGVITNLQMIGDNQSRKIILLYTYDTPESKDRRTLSTLLSPADGQARFKLMNIPVGRLKLQIGNSFTLLDVAGDVKDFVWDFSTSPPTGVQQSVTISVLTDTPNVKPNGTLNIQSHWYNEAGQSTATWSRPVPLRDGVARVNLPTPNELIVSADNIAGFYFDEQVFKISGEPDSLTVSVRAKPAGAIYGKTFNADGELYLPEWKYILYPKYPQPRADGDGIEKVLMRKVLPYSSEPGVRDGNFMVALPFDTPCRILAQDQFNYTLSESLTVTASQPIQHVELRRKQGVDFTGKIIAADGEMPVNFKFNFMLDGGSAGNNRVVPVAADGGFVIPDVNFDIKGYYQLDFGNNVFVKIDQKSPQPLIVNLHDQADRQRR